MAQCLKMLTVVHKGTPHRVPCGKCGFCLQSRRSQWMFRVFYEMRYQWQPGYFLTLTYDEKHVKRTISGKLSLRFRDVQLYLKRLRFRKYYVKYICVGEYGSNTARPHYHMLLWTDAPPSVLQEEWKSSKDGSPLGHIQFGTLTMQSAMYTLKYIIQPKHRWSDEDLRENTRAQFSRGLGVSYLGRDFLSGSQVLNYHAGDEPNYKAMADGREVSLPRYYRNKIFTKYQNACYQQKVIEEIKKKEQEEIARVAALGVENPKKYLFQLRVEQARRILSNSKYTEVL